MTIIYSADDPVSGRWAGVGRLVTAYEANYNFYQLDTRVATLEANYSLTVSLASISQPTASSLLFTLTDATTFGPFTIPVSTEQYRGDWATSTAYLVNDTFNAPDGGLYRVTFDHTSDPTSFSPSANDGAGHDYYAAMIPPRGNTLPSGGATGQVMQKSSGTDYAVTWGYKLPTGGTLNQVLLKQSSTNQDADWTTLSAPMVSFAPVTGSPLVSTNVADAIEEAATRTISSSNVSFSPSTGSSLTSTDVQGAIDELETEIGAITGTPGGFASYLAAPTGNVSTSEKAMGLGGGAGAFTFTPAKTGAALVWIGGIALNSTAAGDGVTITGRWGTGTPPANGDTSGFGTQFSTPQHFIASTTAGQQGFLVMGKVTGMTVGATYWFDLSIVAVTGGGAAVKDVQFVAIEAA